MSRERPGRRLRVMALAAVLAMTACAESASSPLVVVHIFTDLECPHCARAEAVMARVSEAWPGAVRVDHRHLPLPFHPRARPAAVAVEAAAQQGAGERMRERLFATRESWPELDGFPTYLGQVAKDLGLDFTRFAVDMADLATQERVQRDARVAGLLDVQATPTVWVNGRRVSGRIDFSSVARLVRQELAEARRMLQEGVPHANVATARVTKHMGDKRRGAWLLGLQAPPSDLPGAATRPLAPLAPRANQVPDNARWAVPIDRTSPSREAKGDALVTMVLFEDLSSPFSKRLQPTLNALLSSQGQDVRVTYRHLPLPHNPTAKQLAFAAHCAHEQGRFWAMREALLTSESPDPSALLEGLELNAQAFAACLASERPSRRIDADAQVARRVAVGGTPVLFVNGRKAAGARPLAELEALLVRERQDARARLASPPTERTVASLHDVITKHGRARVPLAAVPTAVAELPVATRGSEVSPFNVQAWLDLSNEQHRRSLKALVSASRERTDLSLAIHPASPEGKAEAGSWQRALWCARSQGKAWALLDATAAAAQHSHGGPMARVHEGHDEGDEGALEEGLKVAGVDLTTCEAVIPAATFPGPTWLVNGRRYDGSMGWGPPALRRILTFAAGPK